MMNLNGTKWILLTLLGTALLIGCGSKEEAKTGSGEPNIEGDGTPGKKLEVPPPSKHVSEAPPSKEMKGEWVLEPNDKQRETNAKAVAMGRKPSETTFVIEGSTFTLSVITDVSERVIKGESKQEGPKITLTAKSVSTKIKGKDIEAPLPNPTIFTLQEDGLTIKDDMGLVYVRK